MNTHICGMWNHTDMPSSQAHLLAVNPTSDQADDNILLPSQHAGAPHIHRCPNGPKKVMLHFSPSALACIASLLALRRSFPTSACCRTCKVHVSAHSFDFVPLTPHACADIRCIGRLMTALPRTTSMQEVCSKMPPTACRVAAAPAHHRVLHHAEAWQLTLNCASSPFIHMQALESAVLTSRSDCSSR